MIVLYHIVLILLCIPALLYFGLVRRGASASGFLSGARERLGFWDLSRLQLRTKQPAIWVHCASLGEVRAAEPLLRALHNTSIVLTTLTLSGRAYAEKNNLAAAVYFAPLDFPFLVLPVLRRLSPRCLILVETELWPGMMWAAQRTGIPLFLVNARMSSHSYPFYTATRRFWRPFMASLARVAARSADDADRFQMLGCDPARITVTGNIKYDREFSAGGLTREEIGLTQHDIVFIAGSTRDGEEALLVPAILALRKKYPSLKLIIAPRHLHRIETVERLLSFNGARCARRSAHAAAGADCIIVDTFGELQKLYAVSDIAFVGGSLVSKGGQNPIEPAAYGKPVLFGPDMANFEAEARSLEAAGGGFRVLHLEDFTARLDQLLADPSFRAESGAKAAAAVAEQKGAVARTLAVLGLGTAGAGV